MLAQILGWDIPLMLVVALIGLAIPIWAIVDIASRPASAFEAIGSSRTTWLVLVIIFTLACGILGLVLALIHLLVQRPKLELAART